MQWEKVIVRLGSAIATTHPACRTPSFPALLGTIQLVDQVNVVEEPDPLFLTDAGKSPSWGQFGFTGSCSSHWNHFVSLCHELASLQLFDKIL
jgi:hypothetical protein